MCGRRVREEAQTARTSLAPWMGEAVEAGAGAEGGGDMNGEAGLLESSCPRRSMLYERRTPGPLRAFLRTVDERAFPASPDEPPFSSTRLLFRYYVRVLFWKQGFPCVFFCFRSSTARCMCVGICRESKCVIKPNPLFSPCRELPKS